MVKCSRVEVDISMTDRPMLRWSVFLPSNLSVSLRSTAPLVGEPLAKRRGFPVCQGLPSVGEVALRSNDGEVQPQRLQPTYLVMLPSAHSVA